MKDSHQSLLVGEDAPISSLVQLRERFTTRLHEMLQTGEGASLILALANASLDPLLWQGLEPQLATTFAELGRSVTTDLRSGKSPSCSSDDLTALLKLMVIGFDQLSMVEKRDVGGWEVQYNLLRALRPQRFSGEKLQPLHRPFDPDGFHFDRPALRRESLWQGELAGWNTLVLFNKFPFVEYHTLLVPEPEAHRPQLLGEQEHHFAWRLVSQLSVDLPGCALGYNALGADASVNHLHFHFCHREQPLPITAACWRHNGGEIAYPVVVERFAGVGESWQRIAELHAANCPYNLLYQPDSIWLISRQNQGAIARGRWGNGAAWYEVAGGLILSNRKQFEQIKPQEIGEDLARIAL
jgi:diadenosine tetraphosphate (Ap4A) HIT family hydrolase